MEGSAIALGAVLGLLAGWFVIVRVVERVPEPTTVPVPARVAIAVVNAALWAADVNRFNRWWIAATYFVVFSTLLAVSVVDLRIYRIPDRIVFPAVAATLVLVLVATYAAAPPGASVTKIVTYALAGSGVYFAILFVFHVVYPRGMGFGDVKLAILMGLSLGWLGHSFFSAFYLVLIALFLGCLFGIGFGLAVRLIRGRGGAFPFGPALALATVYVVLTFDRYVANLP
ncbi:MAG TPA: A24 family peptidase [Acidimicrobiales bacterium]|jgi:leader peptidase (prepilin peptidase)/N-methyltransferase|nr:A24 family peptidase [Acidimicrobiales bacterium]